MNFLTKLAVTSGLVFVTLVGCSGKPKQIAPAKAGTRNDNCEAKNDCASGLSCISGRCQPTDYNLAASGKECVRHQCDETSDCCGDRPSEAPAKCAGVESICESPSLVGCDSTGSCADDAVCGEGTCVKESSRSCAVSAGACSSNGECFAETCVLTTYGDATSGYTEVGACSLSNTSCKEDAECPYFGDVCGDAVVAEYGYCDCSNPDYDPADEICDDPDCDGVCTLVCDNNLCVEDESCENDDECPSLAPICNDGVCVECEKDKECDADNDEECNAGFCEAPCEFDQECPYFNECNKGECEYVGCQDNTDCVLYFSGVDGARLAECVMIDEVGECRIPCENDSHCSETQICQDRFCEEIGCESDAQCDLLLGLHNQEPTDVHPYVTMGICAAAEADEADADEADADKAEADEAEADEAEE